MPFLVLLCCINLFSRGGECGRSDEPDAAKSLTIGLTGGSIAGIGIEEVAVILYLIAVGRIHHRKLARQGRGAGWGCGTGYKQRRPLLRTASGTYGLRRGIGLKVIEREPCCVGQHRHTLPLHRNGRSLNHNAAARGGCRSGGRTAAVTIAIAATATTPATRCAAR